MKIQWYRKYWYPKGKVIGYHEIAWILHDFVGVKYRIEIHRYFHKSGRVKHYIGVGEYSDRFLFKTLKECITEAKNNYKGLVPIHIYPKPGKVKNG